MTTASRADPARTAPWGDASRADRVLLLLAASVVLTSAALVLSFGLGRDQGIYTLVARELLEGGMPYRDAWDFKPPGIFVVYALARALFGDAPWGIRVLEALGLVATALGLVRLAERWWGDGRIGVVAAALAALVHAQLDFWHTAQPETFGGMVIVAGLVVGARREPGALRLVVAGALFGLAGWLKPPLAGAGAVFALWDAARRFRSVSAADGTSRLATLKRARAHRPLLWVLLGGTLPGAMTLGWFVQAGALDDLHRTLFVFTPHYTALGWAGQHLGSLAYRALSEWLVGFSSGIGVGLLLALAQWRTVATREGVSLLLGVVGIQLLGVALQGKFFPYHYAGCWPVSAMVAALGWWGLWRWAQRQERGRRRWAILGVSAAWGLALVAHTATVDLPGHFFSRSLKRARVFLVEGDDRAGRDALASVADVDAGHNRRIAAAIRERTGAGEPIYVWGFEPIIYDLAQRPAASRYVYNIPQRVGWSQQWARPELMADLAARPPSAIVVVDHDAMPQVTGDGYSSAAILDDPDGFVELRALILSHYRYIERIGDHELYLREPPRR